MKYIKKSKEPKSLTAIKNLENTRYEAKFNNLPPNAIQDIVQSLLKDQGYLCCFCMNEITEWTAQLIHFLPEKHLTPKS